MDRWGKRIFIFATVFLFTVFSLTSVFGQEVIKIGVIGPMKFVQGIGHWNGAIMAAEEINAKGGLQVGNKKMKIELVQADSNEFINVTDATNAMERLMTKDKVDFVVGGFRSEAVLAMQDIAMENKKIFIGVGASLVELCHRVAKDYNTYKYWFRESPFNDMYLGQASFILLGTTGAVVKQSLNIPQIKVAVVAEKAMWTEGMIKAAEGLIPKMGMEIVGVWRPSDKATDVTAELSAIQRSEAQVIFTIFSASVGITFARQAGELKIPAMQVGINVEAQKDGFWQATQNMGNYVFTLNTYARNMEQNELTKPFVDGYVKRFGETPAYTADTYAAIVYTLAPSIEKVGTIDSDKVVAFMENYVHKSPGGVVAYLKDAEGRPTHELKWGPGFVTGVGVQWQDDNLMGVWPNKWKAAPQAPEVTYKGVVPLKIPPWMIEKYKK
jgi:branched-chain amino acid transport system substrate-binding protein